jgi:hypothetical protein
MSEPPPSEEVLAALLKCIANTRAIVDSRLARLIEDDGRYLNVDHVKYQREEIAGRFDILTQDVIDLLRGRWSGS